MRIMLPVALLIVLLSGTASALTVQEVVALSKAGVSDEVLLSLIERDKTIFSIDASQLIALTRDRVSEKLVLAMLHSGRQEPPPAPAPAALVTHVVPPEQGSLMFGHGPTRPNTYHEFDQLGLAGPSVVYAPITAAFAVPPALSRARRRRLHAPTGRWGLPRPAGSRNNARPPPLRRRTVNPPAPATSSQRIRGHPVNGESEVPGAECQCDVLYAQCSC